MTPVPARASRTSPWLVAALAVPGVLVALTFAVTGLLSFGLGTSPALAPTNRSLAEAAGNRDAADAVWRISTGESLSDPQPVRMPLKLDGEAQLTPLEAAVLSEWTPMIQLLIDAGALADPSGVPRLRCLAARERDRDTIAFLASIDEGRPLRCDGLTLPAYVRRPVP